MHHQPHHQQQYQEPDEHLEPGEEEEEEGRVLEPLQPHLQLLPVQVLDVQHASALVSWPQATYTLPEHDNDDEQVAYQLQVHYRVSYTLQVQPVPLGPPTAEQPVEQLLSGVPGAVVDSAWKDVLTLEEAPAQPQKVGSLRAGRFYAVRLRGHVYAELDSGPVSFNDTFTSDVVAFRTLPCIPGQMQAPSLARRDRTLLKLKWNLPDETGGEVIKQYQLKVKPLPPSAAGSPPDEEGFCTIYEGPGEGPPTSKDRTHFTLKPLGPGQKYSFRIRCFNPLGVGNWSLSSTFTTAASVPSQPDPPRLVQSTAESATLVWEPPADNGSAITFYALEIDDGCGGDFRLRYTGQAEPCTATIPYLQSGLHYRVRLRAENSEGRSQWSPIQPISTAASLPSCPVGLKLGATTRSSVSLSWSPPAEDGGSEVQEYEVQLLPISKIAVADLGGKDWLSIYQGPGLSTSWNSLRAGCKYQLRVACRNAVGYSQYSVPVIFVTAPDAPLPPPRLSALVESRALFIDLQPPAHDGGSTVTQYTVLMRCSPGAAAAAAAAASPGEPQPFTSTEWAEKWRGEYKGAAVPVLNLLPGTLYEFRAAACNNFGSSMLSEIGSATTLPAEPLPPQAPQLVSAAGSNLVVSWQEPYGQGSPVTKYKLSYACLGPVGGGSSRGHSRSSSNAALLPAANGHAEPGHALESGDDIGSISSGSGMGSSGGPAVDKLRWEQAYHGSDLSAAAKQLLPAHRYLLRVRASNDIGASLWSQPLAAATAAAAPCQPLQLAASAEGSRSIAVSWQPPEVDNGSPVTSYHLEVQPAGGGAGAGWTMVWQGSKLGHTVGELLPGRKYSWRVRAVNGCGVGPWAESPPVSTAPSVPGPPGRPSSSKVTATSAKVKWGIPLEDHGAAVKTYHVRLRQVMSEPRAAAGRVSSSGGSSSSGEEEAAGSTGGAEWQEVYAGPLLDTTVTRLQPGTRYELRVAAANVVGLGRWSPAAELATPLQPPPAPTALSAELCEEAAQPGSVAVSWQQKEPEADSAAPVSVIVEAIGSGSKEAAARATVHVGDGSSAVLQGLRPGCTYSIRVRAVGAGSTGHSAWCEGVSVAVPGPLVDPAAAAEGLAGPAAEGAGKRAGKGKGAKGASKGGDAAAQGEVQPRARGGRGKKGAIVDPRCVAKRPAVEKPFHTKMWLRVQKIPYIKTILVMLLVVAFLLYWFVLPKLREAGVI